ncbi:2,3-bisphosphoglycerate-independent phosphoglycerate mutase [Vulcanimicrobium alpinum]|uniref:2,3-bisphosphoglycerate-independent phosphoglycerate mutase n=1 Tax=Vulcanimicrobium alpinum TaxID=3016050 RepID=A0AAN2CB83_UNVUL|nr:2,3-bisphosphoglycerate-independent phosphoglycerate mutase [Vulcanimicrobium alpinum]BDE07708.1 2,3-bisphosphoglycerate-independent phosphoglycerate mutase [Vulcanimicrobium alpinum]
MSRRRPLVLAILDGWGTTAETHGNAIAAADLPNWTRFLATYPHALLEASGEAVGLPAGVMGNSEVGHINIGSGRVVPQGVVVIDEAIASGSLSRNPVLADCFAHVRRSGGRLHLLGLVSDGKVHSSLDHLEALIGAAVDAGVPFAIDAFLDGRDTPPRSAQTFLDRLEAYCAGRARPGAIATVIGRYFAMDRDKRWDRTRKAYDALAKGQAEFYAASASAALRDAYARGENDEFVQPTIVGEPRPIADGDACIFFNFRPDRARQLTLAFSDSSFEHFPVHRYADFAFATMTRYEENFPNPVLFGPRPQFNVFGEIVAGAGRTQLRLAETEKYAHVTYFFNGGREDVFPGEDRILVPSNRVVATYDLAPEMSAADITAAAIEDVSHRRHDLIVMNYANADMVGHTGVWDATISALETLDVALGRLEKAVLAADGILAITSDHGNAEEKLDADGNPLTAHTTNPVPFLLIANGIQGRLTAGKLGDVAPTLLPLLGLDVPAEMTGTNLLASAGTEEVA